MWRALAHVSLGIFIAPVTFSIVLTLLALSAGLAITFPLAVPVAWLLFTAADVFGRVERSRFAALLDLDLEYPHDRLPPGSWIRRLWHRVKSASRWREIAYFLVGLPLSVVTFAVTVTVWSGSLALIALPLYVGALPGNTAEFGLFDVATGGGAIAACAVGIVGLALLGPWLTVAVTSVDRELARHLLAPSRRDELSQQVTRLQAQSVAAVDSAEAERRRIERDLHDGAQQRLVALAMDLGMARERFEHDPDAARQLVAEAHEEAKAALIELRDLVRGFNPAILQDRGLDAALSSVVARLSIPVALDVQVNPRPKASVESTAYFVVAEALTNVAKHSNATRASVTIARQSDRLVIEVTDNGVGGAEAARGSGLRGLDERVRAFGGWFQVISPPGGPTTIIAELPCGS
jgi:signal transduction histidine kinase